MLHRHCRLHPFNGYRFLRSPNLLHRPETTSLRPGGGVCRPTYQEKLLYDSKIAPNIMLMAVPEIQGMSEE